MLRLAIAYLLMTIEAYDPSLIHPLLTNKIENRKRIKKEIKICDR